MTDDYTVLRLVEKYGNVKAGKMIISALKLKESVEKMIKSNGKDLRIRQKSRSYQGWCAESIIDEALHSLVEESEK